MYLQVISYVLILLLDNLQTHVAFSLRLQLGRLRVLPLPLPLPLPSLFLSLYVGGVATPDVVQRAHCAHNPGRSIASDIDRRAIRVETVITG